MKKGIIKAIFIITLSLVKKFIFLLKMGGSSSKPNETNRGIEESSSGLHIVEIHAPTVGVGFMILVIAVVLSCAAYVCYRHIKKRTARRMDRRQSEQLTRNTIIEFPSRQRVTTRYVPSIDDGPRFQDVTEELRQSNRESNDRPTQSVSRETIFANTSSR